ncbi:MAG: hypothetical protein JSW54_03565 [Fidelibacterota bacterium]|nr:MAG: hypothetical protein JSW54_03565 [Candidatus Neomarinimicrobiota bacterium]
MDIRIMRTWVTVMAAILVITGCQDQENGEDSTGYLPGRWQLTELTADWVREVANPEGTTPDTIYTLTASWDAAPNILGLNAASADRVLATFAVGDTIFRMDTTLIKPVLDLIGIKMCLTLNEDFTYALSGTYPAFLLDPDSCQSELVFPHISDAGRYEVDYNSGQFGIQQGPYDQSLPIFDDGQITFSDDRNSVTISFIDRERHDERIVEIGQSWDEEDRVTHGAYELPVDKNTGAFSDQGWPSPSGYIRDTGGHLALWNHYLTYYALIVSKVAMELITADSATTYDEAMTLIQQRADAGQNEETTGVHYQTLLTDDSEHEFDPQNPEAGGLLTYKINPICVPINEIIEFETVWARLGPKSICAE